MNDTQNIGLAENQTVIDKNATYNITKKQAKISYGNMKDSLFSGEGVLDEIVPLIQGNRFKKSILQIRQEKDAKVKAELKQGLPVISTAICANKIRKNNAFAEAACMIFDMDKFGDMSVMQLIKDELEKEAYIIFESPSGNGLKAIYCLEDTVRDGEIFRATYKHKLADLEKRFGKVCHPDNTHDPVRLCFMSWDEDIRVNKNAPLLQVVKTGGIQSMLDSALVAVAPETVQQATATEVSKVSVIDADDLKQYEDLITKLVPDIEYNDWLKVGIAGKNIAEECLDIWDNWSKKSSKYKAGECNIKWKGLDQKMSKQEAFAWLKKMTGDVIESNPNWWRLLKDKETGDAKALYIDEIKKEQFLNAQGIAKTYRDSAESIYVKRKGAIIEEISREKIADMLFDDLKRNHVAFNMASKKYREQICGEQTLKLTVPLAEHKIHWDTKDTCFLYFSDMILKIDKDTYSTIGYDELNSEFVWKDTLLKQTANVLEEESVFEKFAMNAVGKENLSSLMACIGYMLHRYKIRSNAKLICFCDEDADTDNGKSKGGRGKGIIAGQLLTMYRNVKQFDGKEFDPTNNFAWQGLTESHSIIYIEDLKKNYNFELLFNVITSGLNINNKNKAAFYIMFEKLAKIIVDSNYVIGRDDDSSIRRKIEIPFRKYYSKSFTPDQEFGHTFFTDWDEQEWARCNWFIVRCIQLYLIKGLIQADTSGLVEKRIRKEVGEMYDWIHEHELVLKNYHAVKEIQNNYINDEGLSEREKLTGKKVINALRAYASKHNLVLEDKSDWLKAEKKTTRMYRLVPPDESEDAKIAKMEAEVQSYAEAAEEYKDQYDDEDEESPTF